MSSIVKDELDKIKSFAESTEKRGSKLTLNELNYISDKQLHQKSSGGDSPVGLAKVKLLPEDSTLNVGNAFYNTSFAFYNPNPKDSYPPIVVVKPPDNFPFNEWDADMESGFAMVAPQDLIMKTDRYEYEIEGSAEMIEDEGSIHVTGDCTITVSSQE